MTREEAIKVLNDYDINFEGHTAEEIAEAHEMAIKALQQQSELLILKASFSLREAELKEWSERIKKEKEEGLIILPSYFEPILVPNDVKIKIEQEPKTEGARGDIPLQQSVPEMPQPKERTEERTEMHACDCISRQAVLELLHKRFVDGFDGDKWWNSTVVLYVINEAPLVTPQPKEEPQQKTGHWIEHKHGEIEHIECSECGIWFLKANLIRKSYCPNCGSCNGDMIKNILKDIAKQ